MPVSFRAGARTQVPWVPPQALRIGGLAIKPVDRHVWDDFAVNREKEHISPIRQPRFEIRSR